MATTTRLGGLASLNLKTDGITSLGQALDIIQQLIHICEENFNRIQMIDEQAKAEVDTRLNAHSI